MPFEAFDIHGSNTDDKEWLSILLEDLPELVGTTHDVRTIIPTRKGMVIETNHFKTFYYKSHPIHGFVLEFVESWVTNDRFNVPTLMLKVTKQHPTYALLGCDINRKVVLTKEPKYYHFHYLKTSDNPEYSETTNPLPLPTPVPNTMEPNGVTQQPTQTSEQEPPKKPRGTKKSPE